MITGLLLLPIRIQFGEFYKKRLLRIAVPFILWSLFYNLFPWITGLIGLSPSVISDVFAYAPANASQSLSDALRNIIHIPFGFNVYTVPMWYLYMLIGLYLYLPFFSAWVEKATVVQKRIFLAILSVTLFLPYAYTFFSNDLFGVCAWNSYGTFYYFAGFNGYLLLGNYLANDVKRWNWIKSLGISLPMFAIGYIVTYFGFKSMTTNPNCSEQEMELFFLYCSPNVMLMTVAIFMIVRNIDISTSWVVRAFSNITKCGLGIYMVHYFVVGLGYSIVDVLEIPISVRIPITAIITFCISWSFVALCFRIMPKESKWIFG